MLILIIVGLGVALFWTARRYRALRRGVSLLTEAIGNGRSLLHDSDGVLDKDPAWRSLVTESARLVEERATLKSQGADQLNQLKTTLGSLREGVLVVDRDNYVVLANPAVGRIFPGVPSAVGKRLETILHSVDFIALLDEVRRTQESTSREIEFRESGRIIWVEATGAIVPVGESGAAPWCLFVLHDITRTKELEMVRKEFVANVSHELKTPLAMVKGYAETLAGDDGTMAVGDRLQFARTIERHADRLTAIVNDLLTLSRLESGGGGLQRAWHSVDALMRSVAEEFRGVYAATGHTLFVRGEGTGLETHVDPLRLGQVLTNLLENAQKYTPSGSRVELAALALPNGSGVEISVEDNGPGIPAADLPRVFERFYRVEKGRSRDKGGTGLGLSIAKHIVQLHGGQIRAASTVGQGTRMSFRLPARRASVERGELALDLPAERADGHG